LDWIGLNARLDWIGLNARLDWIYKIGLDSRLDWIGLDWIGCQAKLEAFLIRTERNETDREYSSDTLH